MTGAGFGGCHISLVKDEFVTNFKDKVSKKYEKTYKKWVLFQTFIFVILEMT